MAKPLLLLIGYRAYGDWIFTIPVLPYLFDKYRIHLETTQKGYELFHNDPRFEGITVFNLESFPPEKQLNAALERWKFIEEYIKPDKVINLWRTLENECIVEAYQPEFYLPVEERREMFGSHFFLDAVFNRCEVPIPKHPKLDCMYYAEDEIAWGERWRKRHESDFLIAMPIAGSCMHKVVPKLEELSYRILDKYHNAHIYLLGDMSLEPFLWKHDRIYHSVRDVPVKQTFLAMKYVDMAIGPETGAMVAAGMWGTPKIMFCTASSVAQCTQFQKNDYSVQADIPCSPCHRAVYFPRDCEHTIKVGTDDEGFDWVLSECTDHFDIDYAMSIVDRVYEEKNIYNSVYADRFTRRAQTDLGKKIIKNRWSLIEKYCHGKLSLLDYGCASGAFHKSSRNGFKTTGYDVNPHYGYKEQPCSTDVLTMWDVIEHLHKPDDVIKKFNPKYLFICTPNVDAAGEITEWKHYRPNEHLHYFSLKSLTDLLNRNGYKVLEHNFDEGAIRDPEVPENIITVVGVRE